MNKKSVRFGAKTIAVILAVALIVGCVVSGTVAWLITETDPVVNTFTYGDINITLEETDSDEDGNALKNEYKMIPGSEIEKDPKVTVLKNSEACWLFVKLEKSENFDDFLTYEMADGWTELEEGVYYRVVEAIPEDGADAEFEVLKDNKVTVKGDVTKEMLNELDKTQGSETYPTLTVTAYAVQRDNIETAAEAWALVLADEAANQQPAETTAATEAPAITG